MKNTIKFKAIYRIAGIIAVAALIMVGMAACDTGGDDDGGGGKTYTVSLDKVDDRSFTITLEGGQFASTPSFSKIIATDLTAYDTVNNITDLISINDFGVSLNDTKTVVTYTLQSGFSDLTGTVRFWDAISGSDFHMSGYDPYKGDTLSIKTGKKSITF